METSIFTSRLKLTLVTTAERGSPELAWLHELRSNEQVTWWSILGRSKSIEDTEKAIQGALPITSGEGGEKTYRVLYAVHELVASTSDSESGRQEDVPTRFIGLVALRSLGPKNLPLPTQLFPSSSTPSSKVLNVELSYSFLPAAWGKGYATESMGAVFDACRRSPNFWAPFEKVYVRAIVNAENPASQRVMAKSGMTELGMYVWEGKAVWLAGRWTDRSDLHIYGSFLRE